MLARRAYIPDESLPRGSRRQWPLDVPCVAQLADEGMTFERPVTFLVGENGSGKSTLVEAFAEAWAEGRTFVYAVSENHHHAGVAASR